MTANDIIFISISIIFFIFSIIPLIKSPFWLFRIFDYPRFQLLVLNLILLFIFSFLIEFQHWTNWVGLTLIFLNMIYLGRIVYPYTFIHKKMIDKEKSKSPEYSIKLMTTNVYQFNKNYSLTLKRIEEVAPDVVFLLETNKSWERGLQPVKKDYPYFIEIPKENTYGLLFYSKFPIVKQQINYLIDPEIPSIMVDLNIDGKIVRLYGIHPTPPVPNENKESTDRDAEILLVGKKSKEFDGPSIVFGDLNDVAWSHTTRLFLRTSKMLDPRIGRGMYSTFHAHYPLFRWPLDHFFVSSHFRLIGLKVEKGTGSDHFPISVHLSIRWEDKEKELEADTTDHKEAQEIISEAKEN